MLIPIWGSLPDHTLRWTFLDRGNNKNGISSRTVTHFLTITNLYHVLTQTLPRNVKRELGFMSTVNQALTRLLSFVSTGLLGQQLTQSPEALISWKAWWTSLGAGKYSSSIQGVWGDEKQELTVNPLPPTLKCKHCRVCNVLGGDGAVSKSSSFSI